MVKDHSDSQRVNPLPPHGLVFPNRIVDTTAFVTPVVEHWLEREIAQWVDLPIIRQWYVSYFVVTSMSSVISQPRGNTWGNKFNNYIHSRLSASMARCIM